MKKRKENKKNPGFNLSAVCEERYYTTAGKRNLDRKARHG